MNELLLVLILLGGAGLVLFTIYMWTVNFIEILHYHEWIFAIGYIGVALLALGILGFIFLHHPK